MKTGRQKRGNWLVILEPELTFYYIYWSLLFSFVRPEVKQFHAPKKTYKTTGGHLELKSSAVRHSSGHDSGYFLVFLRWSSVMLTSALKRHNFLFVKIHFLNGFSFQSFFFVKNKTWISQIVMWLSLWGVGWHVILLSRGKLLFSFKSS